MKCWKDLDKTTPAQPGDRVAAVDTEHGANEMLSYKPSLNPVLRDDGIMLFDASGGVKPLPQNLSGLFK